MERFSHETPLERGNFLGKTEYSNLTLFHSYLPVTEHLSLYYTKLTPLKPPTQSLVIIHGFGEHSGRFLEVATTFAELDYEVHLIDFAGFGYSGGLRFISSVKMLHQNLIKLLEQVNPELPLHWYAHSMGAGLSLSFLMRNPSLNVASVCLSGPLLNVEGLDWEKKVFLYLLGKKLKQNLKFSGIVHISSVSVTGLVRDEKKFFDIMNDRLMAPFISIGLARELLKLCRYVLPKAKLFRHPLLLLQGEEDQLCKAEYTQKLFDTVSSKDKQLKLFKNGLHELQHDFFKQEFLIDMISFFGARAKTATPLGKLPQLKFGVVGTKTPFFRLCFMSISLLWLFLAKVTQNKIWRTLWCLFGLLNLRKCLK